MSMTCGVTSLLLMLPMLALSQVPPQRAAPAGQTAPPAVTEQDRLKAFQADADRLATLAAQLKAALEHTRRDELSVKVVRTADEIDRLARSARTRVH